MTCQNLPNQGEILLKTKQGPRTTSLLLTPDTTQEGSFWLWGHVEGSSMNSARAPRRVGRAVAEALTDLGPEWSQRTVAAEDPEALVSDAEATGKLVAA